MTANDSHARVVLEGELDTCRTPRLRHQLHHLVSTGVTDIDVDMMAVTFVDAATLGVLVGVHRRLASLGGRITLVDVPSSIRGVLQITGLDKLLLDKPADAMCSAAAA